MKRVLVVAPAWVGDMVMAQTLFKQLRLQGVEHLGVIAPKWTLEVTKRMPEVSARILGDFAHGQFAFSARKALGQSLIGDYDTAIVLPKSFKSALIPFFAKIPQRIGYIGELRYGLLNEARKLDKLKLPKTIDRFVYLGLDKQTFAPQQMPIPQLKIDEKNQQQLKNQFELGGKILALCPGAEYGSSKQWALPRYADVANLALTQGYQVIGLGSAKDDHYIKTIQSTAPNVINLAGKTNILDAIDLLGLAKKVLTNDSGLMHIAAATGSQVYAIYGSTTPTMTPPLSSQAVIIENNDINCRPCFKRECPLQLADHHQCMKSISTESVWQKMQENE